MKQDMTIDVFDVIVQFMSSFHDWLLEPIIQELRAEMRRQEALWQQQVESPA